MATETRTYFATCAKGIEYLLRDELRALGAPAAHEKLAGVQFSGDLAMGYRACLESRLASRILMPLAEFDAADADALYAGVQSIDWTLHLAVDGTLAVDAVSTASTMRHTQFIAQRVKDAIVDQFRASTGARPSVDIEQPSVRINLRLYRDRATLSLDLSGTPLHRRGWRRGQGEAPLKENLAAAMLLRAGWPQVFAAGGALVDPMCGAGTLLIEGALMAADAAPGLLREYFGFLGWRGHDGVLWSTLLDDARQRAEQGLRKLPALFFGYDNDPHVLNEAKRNAQAAGVAGFLHLARRDVDHLQRPEECTSPGLVICNPPYGERIGEQSKLAPLYHTLGDRLRTQFIGWRAAIITSDDELGHALGLRAQKRYVLFNGALECRLLTFDLAVEERPRERIDRPLSAGAEAVANRITKNARHLRKRLAKEAIGCYRIYDADLPEYAAAIDVYTAIDEQPREHETTRAIISATDESATRTWLHVQEYAPPKDVPENTARDRMRDLVRATTTALDVPRERIALKTRYRAKGGSKYGRLAERNEFLWVEEGGLAFRVNLFDYLDTGLFLDHRPVRARIRELALGKRFLNLFCYTATASVHAAAGGARTTTSVDLSGTYLEWASRNFARNGFTGAAHLLVQADVLSWLAHEPGEYDLIFVDPPTFSNSKRTDDFDVQRDHVRLLELCVARLARDGLILFSTNARRFRLDGDALGDASVRDITTATIPFDFARNPRIHACYELVRANSGIANR
ncbi:MAG TPA: bifunctional 23S rRNA (guanine(2069)-N(7))-methyltransferase RlmK/23S rRNA (guanine(2445)-N(2))-methyltransferase RlmL [Rhodanobacteraceae bacterium]|jgi:23S rRNA (guanine2445-N2)-methyltransferase / 23S rRNA (guanine2069-N7)-methyltransferase|nr:bifunctional 23S rRNA (guanine(2069)-N(7))-methyltransferase RlmK/23S rRNA (guanine(2445)-N(2))-methyltransferase RlmL [Rhodanobacteraceae bacterium]